ncbi:HNH endonuclease [Halalkalibaculum sp. DA3122]|uniref:HNH endonuclease n=1 Tax=Halalkalibaculum sp. DA3122 TaxID=3373607 RepID=UPI003754D9D5
MNSNWTNEDLRAAIKAYLEMLDHERNGTSYVKTEFYKKLSKNHDPSAKSFEYRMQNISHILDTQGRQWIPGLKPARNVGTNVTARIERILSEVEKKVIETSASFEEEVRNIQSKIGSEPPKGTKKPHSTSYQTTHYERDPKVVAWVLNQANGICECCEKPAPFNKGDGTPFLEVHHIQRLADDGEDTVNNAIALCPNCHRELHFGSGKMNLAKSLVDKIDRLNSPAIQAMSQKSSK